MIPSPILLTYLYKKRVTYRWEDEGGGFEIGKNHIVSAFLEKVSKKGKRWGSYIYPSYVSPRMAELH